MTEKRNYGIDLLRIFSMIMIACHHILYHGGLLENAIPFLGTYQAAWLLDIAVCCAVNIYGMISGYVGYGRKHRISRFLELYLQVLFYTVLTTVFFRFYKPELIDGDVIRGTFFPFAYRVYWYYTAYFCLCFVMPFLDKLIAILDQKETERLLTALFLVTSLLPTVFNKDFVYTDKGYTFLWLTILYLTGAYIKKYNIGSREKRYRYLLGFLLCILFVWFVKMGSEQISYMISHVYRESTRLNQYVSPFIILCAMLLVLSFKEFHLSKEAEKMVAFFSAASFDVYLFHDAPLIRTAFIAGAFINLLYMNPVLMILSVIGLALVIWFAGSMIGWLRILIFRILRVGKLCEWIETQFRKIGI